MLPNELDLVCVPNNTLQKENLQFRCNQSRIIGLKKISVQIFTEFHYIVLKISIS